MSNSPFAHFQMGSLKVTTVKACTSMDEDGGDMFSFLCAIHGGPSCLLVEGLWN
jgi:hypothetical protein